MALLNLMFIITIKPILNIDSSNISSSDWKIISTAIYEGLKEFDGIVLSVASKKEIDDAVEIIFVGKERLISFFSNEDCGR